MSASGDGSTSRSTEGAASAPDTAPDRAVPPAAAADDPCATCRKRRRSCPKYPRKPKAEEDSGQPLYTLGEEIANSVTHGVGCLLAIAGLVLLIVKAALGGGAPEHVASAIVFGVTLILEYLASTLYHAIAVPGAKRIFRVIDHSCIYLLIAGSYTPFCLITLADDGGVVLLRRRLGPRRSPASPSRSSAASASRAGSPSSYTSSWVGSWCSACPSSSRPLDPVALALLSVGGICYTTGCGFYVMKRIRYMHSVWHLWVLAGSIFIFMAVILYVI